MAGTVSVDDAGVVTGSGTALALYRAIEAEELAVKPLPDPDVPDPDWDGSAAEWRNTMLDFVVRVRRAWARQAQAHADTLDWRDLAAYGRKGRIIKPMGDVDTVLTAEETARAYIRATGANTAIRTLTFTMPQPADEDEVVFRMFQNNTSGGHAVTCAASYGGATVNVAANATVFLGFTNAGIFMGVS